MSEAKIRNNIEARANKFSLLFEIRVLIISFISLSYIKKGIRTRVIRISQIAMGLKNFEVIYIK